VQQIIIFLKIKRERDSFDPKSATPENLGIRDHIQQSNRDANALKICTYVVFEACLQVKHEKGAVDLASEDSQFFR
jgi:hypothetical protein